MYARGIDGYATKDGYRNTDYPPIPASNAFQGPDGYAYTEPASVEGYDWSVTFGRWGAFVVWPDGRRMFTWPKPDAPKGWDAV